MGGNVFPGENRRYSKLEYLSVVDELNPIFSKIFTKFNVCPFIGDKQSFGDMDVVGVTSQPFSVELLKSIFSTEYVKKNGTTWSLIYNKFQIDLITSNEIEYDFCCNYMGAGDRGNFVGKVAHGLGLKFGHNGLWLTVRTVDNSVLDKILLTTDPIKAEQFLDISPCTKYNNLLEMFENISSSKYFNPDNYAMENLNATARMRDKKRPNYNLFLDYCKSLPKKNFFEHEKDKTVYLELIFNEFPDAKDEYLSILAKKKMKDAAALKFNGNLVSEWTGCEGVELGNLMKQLRITLTPEVIVNMNDSDILYTVKKVYTDMVDSNN